MATPRTPYQDTSVPVERSKEHIRKALREAGARGVQFDELWGEAEGDPTTCVVRFIWPVDEGQAVVRIQVKSLPPERGARGTSWKTSPDQRERQAWRAVAHYLESNIKAATFGLMRFEDIFLSFIEVGPNDPRTIGDLLIPQLGGGRLQLGSGDNG